MHLILISTLYLMIYNMYQVRVAVAHQGQGGLPPHLDAARPHHLGRGRLYAWQGKANKE